MKLPSLKNNIEKAAQSIGKTWPLYGFVTSNPLSGYETQPFGQALPEAGKRLGARVYADAASFRRALASGEIAEAILLPLLRQHGLTESPEYYLREMEAAETGKPAAAQQELNRLSAKWLAAFLDEGLAEWSMPGREQGFYRAWRKLAPYDGELKGIGRRAIPQTATEALAEVLKEFPENDHARILSYHVEALPGWAGYIKYRSEEQTDWHQQCPITLEEYLAARLWMAKAIKAPIAPIAFPEGQAPALHTLQHLWLKAWEATWQQKLLGTLRSERVAAARSESTPDAQLVFCIDTRSEPIRRHVEAQGRYETFGYAGFFGIAMDYKNPENGLVRKSCPPILPSAYQVEESPRPGTAQELAKFRHDTELRTFFQYFLKRMKNMLPSTFGFVEGTGVSYGATLLARTWMPRWVYRQVLRHTPAHEKFCAPELHTCEAETHGHPHLPLAEKVAIVKSAFDLLGWREFAPLVVFSGHGSHTANNPFASSLDCGACAASPGRHNARMLARLANEPAVRQALLDQAGLHIPEDTFFLGAEHNTTTDAITLFDAEVPESHQGRIRQLRADLERAQQAATRQRLGLSKDSVAQAEKLAGDWAETRPEWGLAKNAGFVIGPRSLTRNHNLEGRCFLHSYRWDYDPAGQALEGILQGPMVVTQWINNHYYFTTVDPERFGSGSKITQNPTGKFGVLQGNGGDLKAGLPLQSVWATDTEAYHQPLRLSVMIQAPRKRVSDILGRNENLKNLVANQWIHVLVLDPEQGNRSYRCTPDLKWEPAESTQAVKALVAEEAEVALASC